MSNFLCDMKVGDEISCQGPFGDFILRPPMRDTIFIATGTGIAPFRSMLHWLLAPDGGRASPPVLRLTKIRRVTKASSSTCSSAIGRKKIFIITTNSSAWPSEHPNFDYLPTLSRGGPEWKGLRGYVQEHVPGIVAGRADMHAYICGLDKMVKANRDLLKSLGWDRKSILYEKYD